MKLSAPRNGMSSRWPRPGRTLRSRRHRRRHVHGHRTRPPTRFLPGRRCPIATGTARSRGLQIWRRGFRIRNVPHLTVIKVSAYGTQISYINKDIGEHHQFETLIEGSAEITGPVDRPHPQSTSGVETGGVAVTDAAMRLAAYCEYRRMNNGNSPFAPPRPQRARTQSIARTDPTIPHDMSASELRARYAKEPDSTSR